MMKKILLTLYLMGTVSLSYGLEEETIRITSGEWPPYQSEQLKYAGLASRIVTEAFALEGVKVIYGFFPWGRSYDYAKQGKWDGSILWTKNKERNKFFHYSDVVVEDGSYFFHLKSYPFDWKSDDDLTGLDIGGVIGSKYLLLEKLEKAGKINLERTPKELQNFRKLLTERIQIYQEAKLVGFHILNTNFKPEEVQLVTYHPQPIIQDSFHLILSRKIKKNRHYMDLFNRGLKKLKESGKYDQFVDASIKGEYLIRE